MRILYVEDELAHVELARRALEDSQMEFTMDTVGYIKEALTKVQETQYDVILCDFRLPDGTGLDLIHAVEHLEISPAIVIITNQGDDEIAASALKAGAIDYVVKRRDYLNRLPVVLTNAASEMKIRQHQNALQQSEERYRSLVEKIPAVVFVDDVYNEKRTSRYMSPRLLDLTGYTPEEWIKVDNMWETSLHAEDRERVLYEVGRTAETGEAFRAEYRLRCKDGTYRWVREETYLLLGENNSVRTWQGIMLDITEEKLASDAIRQSEEKFMKIFLSSPIAICITEWNEGTFLDVNAAYCVYTGFDRDELIGRRITDVTGLDLNARKTFLEQLEHRGKLNAMEDEISLKGGGKRLALAFYEILYIGNKRCILSMLYDISDQKKALDALNRRDSILSAVSFASQQFLSVEDWRERINVVLERLGDATTASRVLVFRLHLDEQNSLRTSCIYEWAALGISTQINNPNLQNQLIQHSIRGRWIETLMRDQAFVLDWHDYSSDERKILEPQEVYSLVLVPVFVNQDLWGFIGYDECRDPEREWHSAEIEALSVAGRILGTAIQRELTDKALQAERDFARNILDTMTQGLSVTAGDGTFEYINPALAKMVGRQAEKIIGLHTVDMVIPQELPLLAEERARRQEGQTSTYRLHLLHQDGHGVPVRVTASPRWIDGKVQGTIAVVADLTEQEHAEQALRAVEASYMELFNSIDEAIYIQNSIGEILDVNKGAEVMHGYPREYFIGKTLFALGHPDKTEALLIKERFDRALNGEPQQFEFLGTRKNGERFPVDVHLYNGTYFGQNAVIALSQDITERKATEQILTDSNKTLQRQLQELSVLHGVALAGAQGNSEDEIIEQVIKAVAGIYSDVCGMLLLNEAGDTLIPHPSYIGADISEWRQGYSVHDGISGRVVLTGKPALVADTNDDNDYISIDVKTRSELCVPIKVHEKIIGALNVESRLPGTFTYEDERFLTTVAGGVGSALERIRLLAATQAQLTREAAILEIMRVAASSLDLESVLGSVLNQLLKLIPSDSGSVQLLEKDNLRIAALTGLHIDLIAPGGFFPVTRFPVNDEVINKRRTVYIPDVYQDDRYLKLPGLEKVRSFLALPLLFNDRAIGMITLDSYIVDRFSKEDRELAAAIADHVSVAIENARLYGEEKRRSKFIETLADITNKIATSREIFPALDSIVKQGFGLLKANHMAVYLLENDEQTLRIVSAEGQYREQLLSHTIRIDQGITGSVVRNKRPEVVNDFVSDRRTVTVPQTPKEDQQYEVMMSAPLLLRDKAIGAINAWRFKSDGSFDSTELNFLTSIAHQISVAIESARLFEETVRQAREAEAIAEVGRGISETLQLNVVMDRIAQYAKDLLNSETSAVYLLSEKENSMRAIAAFGLDAVEIKSDELLIGRGILGNIALNQSGEIVNNTELDPRTVIVKGTQPVPSEHIMGVPVLSKDHLVGLIAVWRTGKGVEFKPHELNFLTALGQQAAIAIENARLYDETRHQLMEHEIVSRLSYAMRMAKDPNEMLPILLIETKRIMDSDSVTIWLYDPETNKLVQKAGSGIFADAPKKTFDPNEGIVGRVFTTGEPYIATDIFLDPLSDPDNGAYYGSGWGGMIVPIQSRAKIIGGMGVAIRAPREIQKSHIYVLSTIAEIAGNSIHRAELYEDSKRQVQHLTTLRDIDTAIASSFDLKTTLGILLDYMLREMEVDSASVFEYLPMQDVLAFLSGSGFSKKFASQTPTSVNMSLGGNALLDHQDIYIADLSAHKEFLQAGHLDSEKFISYYAVPLVSKGQSKGLLEAYFRKPFSPKAEWVDFMRTLAGQATIAIDNANLFDNLQRSKMELEMAYDTTLEGWGKALELRDKETQGHTRRVTDLTLRLARRMNLPDEELVHIHRGALLHDIGKMGVPDHILRKEGTLTEDEWKEMRQHPQKAYDLLSTIPYLKPALDIPFCHHEWWDGSGYPRGLRGKEIPLSARIFAVMDVWDALLSDRPYRKAWSREKVIEHLKSESGTHFDPDVVRIFLDMMGNK